MLTYEMAERAAGYYCAVRDLEEELEAELREQMGEDEYEQGNHDGYLSHPDWDKKSDELYDEWNLNEAEQDVLSQALEAGLCDYFGAEDIMEVL